MTKKKSRFLLKQDFFCLYESKTRGIIERFTYKKLIIL